MLCTEQELKADEFGIPGEECLGQSHKPALHSLICNTKILK